MQLDCSGGGDVHFAFGDNHELAADHLWDLVTVGSELESPRGQCGTATRRICQTDSRLLPIVHRQSIAGAVARHEGSGGGRGTASLGTTNPQPQVTEEAEFLCLVPFPLTNRDKWSSFRSCPPM
jgi:hypothetical protein